MKFAHFTTIVIAAFATGINADENKNLRGLEVGGATNNSRNTFRVVRKDNPRGSDCWYIWDGDELVEDIRLELELALFNGDDLDEKCTLFEQWGRNVVLADNHDMCVTAGSEDSARSAGDAIELYEGIVVSECVDENTADPMEIKRQQVNIMHSKKYGPTFSFGNDAQFAITNMSCENCWGMRTDLSRWNDPDQIWEILPGGI